MKKRTLAAASTLAAAVLAITATSPAGAAVISSTTTFAVPNASGAIAVDTSNLNIYVATTAADGSNSLAVVDGTTRKIKATIPISDPSPTEGSIVPESISDIQVNSRTHTIWVDVPWGGRFTFSTIYSVDGATNKVTHTFGTTNGAYRLQVDQGSAYAYTADSSAYEAGDYDSNDEPTPATLDVAGKVYSFNSSTGATLSATLPAPKTVDCGYSPTYVDYYQRADIAFSTSNYGLYIASAGTMWAYSNKLKLAKTTTLPYSQCDQPGIAADGKTVYITDNHAIATVPVSTGAISKTTTFTGNTGRPVADPGVSALYLGTTVITTGTLAKSGTLPYAAVSVNTSSHTIYSAGTNVGYLIKRTTK